MKHDRKASENKDKELLQSDSTHVDVNPELQGLRLDVGSGDDHAASKLHEEGDNVKPDKV